MPDGRTIAFVSTPGPGDSGDVNELRVKGGAGEAVIRLGPSGACAEISPDWTKLLVVKDDVVRIFDFAKVVAAGGLNDAEFASILIKHVSSALFYDAAGEALVTTDDTNHVLVWRRRKANEWASEEVYRGDNPIFYAEFDAEVKRLLFIESLTGSEVHGWLYALPSQQLWFDLGSDYKWLGATFTKRSEIVVSEHTEWKRAFVMPRLSELTTLAEAQLSQECRPQTPEDYRRSPCWPASYR